MGLIADFKGSFSESFTNLLLSGVNGYNKKIKGAVFKLPDETTFQIDTLIIQNTGFYIVENKNYQGWIFGSEKSKEWTTCYPGGKKFKFYNPVRQNQSHITKLRKLLMNRYEKQIFSNIVVFTTKCDLKKIEIESDNTYVEYSSNVCSRINRLINNKAERFDNTSVDKIYDFLMKHADFSQDALNTHISRLKSSIN